MMKEGLRTSTEHTADRMEDAEERLCQMTLAEDYVTDATQSVRQSPHAEKAVDVNESEHAEEPSVNMPLMNLPETCEETSTASIASCLASTSLGIPLPPLPVAGAHSPLLGAGTLPVSVKPTDSTSLMLPTTTAAFSNYESKSNLSETGSTVFPICRICHMPEDETELLISPCRCAGTMQFIHNACLQKWLEIKTKKTKKPPKCELCHYQYNRHKKFKFHHWRFPRVSQQDKVLHVIFVINLLIMVACAIATVMCFLSDKGKIAKFPRNTVDLTTEEIITLSCGVLFFVSFFIAMSVQIKAKHTIYQLFVKFIMQNMEWEIDEYDKNKDSGMFKGTSNCV